MTAAEAEKLVREGLEALRRGESVAARAAFEAITVSDTSFPKPWFLLAQACRHQGDRQAEIGALEQHLAHERDHLPALLMMGEAKAPDDERAAAAFFTRALSLAARATDVPQALHPMLRQAESWLEASTRRFTEHMRTALAEAGVGAGAPPRVADAVAILLGDKQLYLQQPTMFYFPGLPQRQFYDREEFAWLPSVEAETPVMQAELQALLAEQQEFSPYIEDSPNRPGSFNPLAGSNQWGAWYFWKQGQRMTENCARCPQTAAVLENIPLSHVTGRSPMALYSVLEPGAHIIPHHGALNTRLICHIPLIVPGDCALRVGNETRAWEEGKALIFDDSVEHEAWNRSDRTRIILLFEIWRPELSEAERAALATLFEAVDLYGDG